MRRIFFILLFVHFGLSTLSIAHLHYKVDEPHYLDYAVRWAKGNAKRYKLLDDSKTPAVFPALGVGAFYSKLKTQADRLKTE